MSEQDIKQSLEQAFGTLSPQQLWALTKFAKNVRLRARNNSAFNNLCNRLFPYARFQQVTKTRTNRLTGQPETYPGLSITVNGVEAETGEEAGED